MQGETNVKAQVKIIINTGNGRRLLVNRQFQVIKKANGKVEMKTLDTFMKEGDEDAQCKKLEQVNVEVPARMGVSKAILENVIFVHQDESNWCVCA